jgi:hypothetical protein
MGTVRKWNPDRQQWEVFGSTEAKDINLIDVGGNFEEKNVEAAFREICTMLSETNAIVESHTSSIEWLKLYGGGGSGGGGGGGGGTAVPTITSSFEDCVVEKDTDVIIPIFFSSPNLGEGTAYILINDIEVGTVGNIRQGNNKVNIGKLTELRNEVAIYVKDRANLLSNQLSWTITSGGIDLSIDFDDTIDYLVSDEISMLLDVFSASDEPIVMHMTIDYDESTTTLVQGINTYTFPHMGVGVHKISFYLTSGEFKTKTQYYNIVIVGSASLYVSSNFQGGEFKQGYPIAIQYRISKQGKEFFDVKLYLNDELNKELQCQPGTYYWTLADAPLGLNVVKIVVDSASGEHQELAMQFVVVVGDYTPLDIARSGLIYRLDASTKSNQDNNRDKPVDDSGNNVITTLHNFNYSSNGWVDGELVCDGDAYVEIDLKPWQANAVNGSTIEIHYKSTDIGLVDSLVLDYTDVTPPYRGITIGLNDATMKSVTSTGIVDLCAEEDTTLSFVIDRKNKFGKIFINGICSRAFGLSDSGTGTNAKKEDFSHSQKIYINSRKGKDLFGACKIKDIRVYNRVLTDDEIVKNWISQTKDIDEQAKLYNFNYNNTTLPVIRMYGDTSKMTLENAVTMRIKYTSPDEEKYGQSFDMPFCEVNWQGTSSLQYVLKNFTARLKDESMAVWEYTPYPNGVLEDVYCFKADYMESTHARNIGIAKFVNDCLYDTKNPMQLKDPKIRNTIMGFPCLMYINDELQGVYNFNLDRYSTKSFGYTDEENTIVYEVSANSDTTAGAFFQWTPASGKLEDDYYLSDFTCLYPPSRAAGNDNLSELKRLVKWVDTASDEDFRDNISDYFNLEYLLRYYLYVYVFGAVDSLGKNMKLMTNDGRIWYPQVYDADTVCGLDNTGFMKYDMDIEMDDHQVFNTKSSRLWQKVRLLFDAQLKEQYTIMRQGRFTVDNIMKYFYGEQISQIPATYYNKDMQTKYLDWGSSYLYALHGSGEQQLKKWIRERIMYCDTLFDYKPTSADYITLRSSKKGYVYLDIQTYIPMYISVVWRNEANNAGLQRKRVGRGETVRFEYDMPVETDQEIRIYAGHYLKSLGDVSNLQPTVMLIANADRLTEVECHSPNLIDTDFFNCPLLRRVDIHDCPQLGPGIGTNASVDVQNCRYLKTIDIRNTRLTAVHTMSEGSNLQEILYPESVQDITLANQEYLKVVGLPYGDATPKDLANISITNCHNIRYMHYPYDTTDELKLDAIRHVQNLSLSNSLDVLKHLDFNAFDSLMTLSLSTMHKLLSIGFINMLRADAYSELREIRLSDCPHIKEIAFDVTSDDYKVEFFDGCVIDLGGLSTIQTVKSNTSIKGLDTLILPLTVKNLEFTTQFGDGINEIKSIWSATADHSYDNFVGIDFKDMNIEYLDMAKLQITNAINFNIAPKYQHPNLNTYRDGVNVPYFRPQGRLDLTQYKGDMNSMFRGLDFSKLEVIPPNETNVNVTDISYMFEGAIIRDTDIISRLIACYPMANNLDYIFKNADIEDASKIVFPSIRHTMRQGFMNSGLKKDFRLSPLLADFERCFENCKMMTSVTSQWNRKDFNFNPNHSNCYADCVNIAYIDGEPGGLRNIPFSWGGFGFTKEATGSYTVEILSDNYTVTLGEFVEDGTVLWGDGDDSYTSNVNTHTYTKAGQYIIEGKIFPNILGNKPQSNFAGVLKAVNRVPQGTSDYTNMFMDCKSLRRVEIPQDNQESMRIIDSMFKNCNALISPPDLNYSRILSAIGTFEGCTTMPYLKFKDLNTSTIDCSDIIKDCHYLESLEFEGSINKAKARFIIDILDNYIKENKVSVTSLQDDVNGVQSDVESLQEVQAMQDMDIMMTMMAVTSMYEMNLMSSPMMMSMDLYEEPQLTPYELSLARIYTTLINKGYKTIDEIPYNLRNEVEKNLR